MEEADKRGDEVDCVGDNISSVIDGDTSVTTDEPNGGHHRYRS